MNERGAYPVLAEAAGHGATFTVDLHLLVACLHVRLVLPQRIEARRSIWAIAAGPEAGSQIVVLSQPLQAIRDICSCHVSMLALHICTHCTQHSEWS